MDDDSTRWEPGSRDEAYGELDHPADLFLEIWGRDLPGLFENALFALYDHLAELEGFTAARKETIEVPGASPSDALRRLLSEALYRFETKGFVATRANVTVETSPVAALDAAAGAARAPEAVEGGGAAAADGVETTGVGEVRVTARLDGETVDKRRHTLLTEVKAVTYHQLKVEVVPEGGWRATVLFDI